MTLEKERNEIVATCLLLLRLGLTNGTSGNVSIFNRREKLVALTPSGVSYQEMKPEDISILDINGKLIEGKKPSSEIDMHLIFYKNRDDVNAIIHTHPVYITVLACLGEDLPAIDYMIAISGNNKVKCAKYASFGTMELAKNAYNATENSKAVILANHGLTVVAENLKNALNISEQLEYVAQLYVEARKIGNPIILDDKEMINILNKFRTYGQQ